MTRVAMLLMGLLLAACASEPVWAPPTPLFEDSLFAPPSQPVRMEQIFALSDEMTHYVHEELIGPLRNKGVREGLLEALYTQTQLKLEYDGTRTRNASEAFAERTGNCLSLVIMTAAIAKHLNLKVEYHSVYTDETWVRNHDTYIGSGHVNLSLGSRLFDTRNGTDAAQAWTIDFLPPEYLRRQRSHLISEDTVVAMYLNNRAVEFLAGGDLDTAYWWARGAVEHTPSFVNGYNTLGVIYLRHGNLPQAEAILRVALAREPMSTVAMSNLARVLQLQGHADESRALAEKVARIEPEPPFYFFDQGQAAMQAGDFKAARRWFNKELDRAPYQHEFHFWLALADFRLGLMDEARKHLTLAKQNSTTQGEQQLYAAKLDHLRSLGVH